jgi:hypothetical protein
MAVSVAGNVIVTDARQLKIQDTDADTKATLQDALRQDDDKIIIQDSSGTAIHTFFGSRE